MSLLLDALKRAEQEKLARRDQEAHPAGQKAQAPEPAAPRRKLELDDPEPGKAAPAPAERAADPAKASDRESAKTVFAAKQAPSSAPPTATGRNKAILAVAIGAVVLAAAGGAYVWYEISGSLGPMAAAPRPASAPRPVTPAPVAAAAPAPAAAPDAPSSASAPGPAPKPEATPAAPPGAAVPPVAILTPESAAALPAKAKPQPKAAEILVTNLLEESRKAKPAPLKLSRTIEPPRVAPEVSRGYEALRSGDAAAARSLYEAAVAADPTSLDAHLGLAASAARLGDRDTAASHYRRTLALDPRNPSAVAGLAALADFSRPDALEAQLRADITRFPQNPALHFTLGNLYARQSRWNEAQAAYFDAFRLDPDSADLAFNLAVSLDHLGQSRPAAEFYRRALAASGKQAALFDKGQVSRRIAELKP